MSGCRLFIQNFKREREMQDAWLKKNDLFTISTQSKIMTQLF